MSYRCTSSLPAFWGKCLKASQFPKTCLALSKQHLMVDFLSLLILEDRSSPGWWWRYELIPQPLLWLPQYPMQSMEPLCSLPSQLPVPVAGFSGGLYIKFTLQRWRRQETGFENVLPLPQWSFILHSSASCRKRGWRALWLAVWPKWAQRGMLWFAEPPVGGQLCSGFMAAAPHAPGWGGPYLWGAPHLYGVPNKEQGPVTIAGQSPFFPELSPSHCVSACAGWRGKKYLVREEAFGISSSLLLRCCGIWRWENCEQTVGPDTISALGAAPLTSCTRHSEEVRSHLLPMAEAVATGERGLRHRSPWICSCPLASVWWPWVLAIPPGPGVGPEVFALWLPGSKDEHHFPPLGETLFPFSPDPAIPDVFWVYDTFWGTLALK